MANFPSNYSAFPGAQADSRSAFITRTYTHLVGGILGFILVELALFESGLALQIAQFMLGFNWFLILGAFMLPAGWRRVPRKPVPRSGCSTSPTAPTWSPKP